MSHQARKRFGQNFLHDPGVIARIVAAINPRPQDHLVEIGPGLGALTRVLLPLVGTMDVVELDRDVIPLLKQACEGIGTLRVHQGDVLNFDFEQFATDDRPLRIVGNLPYNISTPLLFHVFRYARVVRDMHFMLQKEVVERMVAAPDTEHYGRLSVMVQYHCVAHRLFTVGPGAFKPVPKVESAVVRLIPHAHPPVIVRNYDSFSTVVARAFSQRRKTLRNALSGILSIEQIQSANVDPKARAEQISLADFARLSDAFSP